MIHAFTINNLNLVVDVESGSVHKVDDAAFIVLKSLENSGVAKSADAVQRLFNTPDTIADEINHLISNGLLFSEPIKNKADALPMHRPFNVKALCLHMAHECNLRCRYCFAGQGNYSDSDRGLMPFEVGKKALDFLVTHSGKRRNLEVDFFGGEPMLNMDVVKELVAYGRSIEGAHGKKFRFTLTTNGALLEGQTDYINKQMDNVVLSLDGRPHVHDKMRPWAKGGGSFHDIYPKIKDFVNSRGDRYYVRGTYTGENLDFGEDVLYLADAGFKSISVEPVVAPPSRDYAIREEDLPTLLNEYEKLVIALMDSDARFFHFELNLEGGPCLAKRVTGCGAGSDYLAITPSGKIYPCHQFVGDEKFLLGDLESGLVDTDISKQFASCNVLAKPECEECWAKYYCGGGCMATAYYANGSIMKPEKISCELQKKRTECALYLFVMRKLKAKMPIQH